MCRNFDMILFTFLAGAAFISLSGVMMPGPITAVTIGSGTRSPHAGVLISVGHGIVEFPLMAVLFFGLGYLLTITYVKTAITGLGGLVLLVMAVDMLRNLKKSDMAVTSSTRTPLVSGIVLSLTNPYFLLWWATVGSALITAAYAFGLAGVIALALVHWLCDFVWYYFLSFLSYKGKHFFGQVFQKAAFAVCGIFLIFFSGKFLLDAIKTVF
jgi:threonine/homoserine/homoserine lactone efflux protein